MTFVIIAAVVLGLQALAQAFCARRDARKFPAPGKLVATGNCQLHVLPMGTGHPAAVLEAGISATCLTWSIVQPQLAAFTTAYSYDRAGLGWSAANGRSCSPQAMANDLHAMLEQLQVPRPYILVAHSFGAYVVLAYAQHYGPQGEEIAGVVLVDPLTPEEWIQPTARQRRRIFKAVWSTRVVGILATLGVARFFLWLLQIGNREPSRSLRLAAGATQTSQRILSELTKLPLQVRRLIRVHWSSPKLFWTMANQIQSLPQCAQEVAVAGCSIPADIPVTVISGAHQPPEVVANHAALANRSMQGKHIMAGKSAHWIQFDQPELVVEAVREIAGRAASGC
jgi:pimeloyl-ACP methyl ester carboxylesterase